MSELLPCPFCGGEATIYPSYDTTENEIDGWFIGCEHMKCTGHPETDQFFTKAEAIEAWNTRAERTCYSELSDSWECSECGGVDAYSSAELINYCPNCGRKVEK